MKIIKPNFTLKFIIVMLFFSTFQLIHSSEAFCQKKPKGGGGSTRYNETDEFEKKQGLWRLKSGGVLVAEINYLNNKKHGLSTLYYAASGAMMEVCNYEDGIRDGEYKRYYYNGNINTEGEFKMGKKDGNWIKYNLTNGEVKMEGAYNMGKKNGDWKFYNSKNELVRTFTYKDGGVIAVNGVAVAEVSTVKKTDTKKPGDKKKGGAPTTGGATPVTAPADSTKK